MERGRDRIVFAAPLLGGLTPGGPSSAPSTRKRRTDAELGRFYNEEIYFGIRGATGSEWTFLRLFARASAFLFLDSGPINKF